MKMVEGRDWCEREEERREVVMVAWMLHVRLFNRGCVPLPLFSCLITGHGEKPISLGVATPPPPHYYHCRPELTDLALFPGHSTLVHITR